MNRRDVLAAICIGTTAGLAGCDGTGGDVPDGGDDSGGDDQSGATTEPSAGGDPGSGDGSNASGGAVLGDVQVRTTPNYRFRIDASGYDEAQGDVVMEGSWNDGNYYTSASGGAGGSYETYFVDGSLYYSAGGQCFEMSSGDQQTDIDTGQWADSDETVGDLENWEGLTAAGTTTIEGEQMYVFELTPEDHNVEATYSYYVSAETGYLRRFESEGLVVDYWDWGQTDPIEAPC